MSTVSRWFYDSCQACVHLWHTVEQFLRWPSCLNLITNFVISESFNHKIGLHYLGLSLKLQYRYDQIKIIIIAFFKNICNQVSYPAIAVIVPMYKFVHKFPERNEHWV